MDILWRGLSEALHLIAHGDPQLRQIASLSLLVSLSATLLAGFVGVPLAVTLVATHFGGRAIALTAVNTGMGLPPVVVGLGVSILLWRTGPLGPLALLYTPAAMVFAQFLVAAPLVTGFTRSALELLNPDMLEALRVDGAAPPTAGYELVRAALPQVLVALAAGFGRAIAEVGASLMVGGNILGHTRILTTAIALETQRGDFALAIALGLVLLAIAFAVNAALTVLSGVKVWPAWTS
ncbi:MAG TPA: ABC transporter permease [Dehalococcoidia bacterium]|nr:ABC transporter permease [Dehalococcoidia bacterium]